MFEIIQTSCILNYVYFCVLEKRRVSNVPAIFLSPAVYYTCMEGRLLKWGPPKYTPPPDLVLEKIRKWLVVVYDFGVPIKQQFDETFGSFWERP